MPMMIIKLNATDSTNVYLKELALSQQLDDFTVVSTELQRKGRGQMGSKWLSDRGKNLTVSILKKLNDFYVENQFDLNCIVSLSLYDVLHELTVPNLSVKWPNDILSGNQKICGILIENVLKGKLIHMAILGIGINVNQTDFQNVEKASSLKLLLGQNLDLDGLLTKILDRLKFYFLMSKDELKTLYLKVLFRKDKPSTFKDLNNRNFTGIIRGVDPSGKLLVELEGGLLKPFDLKELKLLY